MRHRLSYRLSLGTAKVRHFGLSEPVTVHVDPLKNREGDSRLPAAMTHTSLVEVLDGRSTDWMEHVADAQYRV